MGRGCRRKNGAKSKRRADEERPRGMRALAEIVELPQGRVASYEVIGEGKPMLYFQGGPGYSASLLRDDAELLADRFAVHLIDPPGSGRSTPPDDSSQYNHLGHARFYEEVRQGLGVERATIMGISFGSLVALTYAALFPDRATRCIAVASRVTGEEGAGDEGARETEQMLARHEGEPWYPSARETWWAWTERVVAAGEASEVDEMMAEILPLYTADPERPGVKRMIDAWRGELATNLEAVKVWENGLYQTIDIRPLLNDVRCPVLALAGELDLICGPFHANALARALPDARVMIIPDCGHFIPAEAPDAFREAILAFAG